MEHSKQSSNVIPCLDPFVASLNPPCIVIKNKGDTNKSCYGGQMVTAPIGVMSETKTIPGTAMLTDDGKDIDISNLVPEQQTFYQPPVSCNYTTDDSTTKTSFLFKDKNNQCWLGETVPGGGFKYTKKGEVGSGCGDTIVAKRPDDCEADNIKLSMKNWKFGGDSGDTCYNIATDNSIVDPSKWTSENKNRSCIVNAGTASGSSTTVGDSICTSSYEAKKINENNVELIYFWGK